MAKGPEHQEQEAANQRTPIFRMQLRESRM